MAITDHIANYGKNVGAGLLAGAQNQYAIQQNQQQNDRNAFVQDRRFNANQQRNQRQDQMQASAAQRAFGEETRRRLIEAPPEKRKGIFYQRAQEALTYPDIGHPPGYNVDEAWARSESTLPPYVAPVAQPPTTRTIPVPGGKEQRQSWDGQTWANDGAPTARWKPDTGPKPLNKLDQARLDKLNREAAEADLTSPKKVQAALDKFTLINSAIKNARKYSGASGRSLFRRGIESSVIGATDYTELSTYIDTIKVNVLTLSEDDDVKKFFGPQMSEADVRMMQANGVTLDPETQREESLLDELVRVEDLIARAEKAVREGIEASGGATATAPEATTSDGATVADLVKKYSG